MCQESSLCKKKGVGELTLISGSSMERAAALSSHVGSSALQKPFKTTYKEP